MFFLLNYNDFDTKLIKTFAIKPKFMHNSQYEQILVRDPVIPNQIFLNFTK